MIYVVLTVCIAIFILLAWNTFTLYRIKKQGRELSEINDSRYFELKYKFEFILAAFALLATVATFLGYNTISDLKGQYQSAVGKIKTLDSSYSHLDSAFMSVEEKLGQTHLNVEDIDKNIISYKHKFRFLKQQFDDLSKRKNSYSIKNLRINNGGKQPFDTTIYFKNLITDDNERLPVFNKPPIVVINLEEGSDCTISKVTSKSFNIDVKNFVYYEHSIISLAIIE